MLEYQACANGCAFAAAGFLTCPSRHTREQENEKGQMCELICSGPMQGAGRSLQLMCTMLMMLANYTAKLHYNMVLPNPSS